MIFVPLRIEFIISSRFFFSLLLVRMEIAIITAITMMMVPFIILIGVMIAISVRTSSKEKKKREEMMNSIRKGTKIMTSGGIIGEIAEVQKDQFLLKVANNVQIAISRTAVAQVITPAADAADATKAEVTKK